jgi:hypothetical protein
VDEVDPEMAVLGKGGAQLAYMGIRVGWHWDSTLSPVGAGFRLVLGLGGLINWGGVVSRVIRCMYAAQNG